MCRQEKQGTMGSGVCSRKQRKIFQSLLLTTLLFMLIYGGMIWYEMHQQLKRTEALALKYQQHQESLSAQLQVVYEHRSRLEKSLQKERQEHKKSKEDYMVYKLEAQQSFNKEKQDASGKLNSLHSQHQILKNQHEELKKQFYELQERHQAAGEDHSKVVDEHQQKYENLQQTKELEVSKLKESVYNLREENRQLRKAHQEIHSQLQDTRQQHKDLKSAHDQLTLTLEDHKSALAMAQVQVSEYKQFKENLNKMQIVKKPGEPSAVAAQKRSTREHQEAQLVKQGHPGEVRGVMDAQQVETKHKDDVNLEQNHEDEKPEHQLPDENAIDKNHHSLQVNPTVENRVKSAYEQQQEAHQHLAAQLEEEQQRLLHRQEELQREREEREREERERDERERDEREREERERRLRQQQLREKSHINLDAAVRQAENNMHPDEDTRKEENRQPHHEEHIVDSEVDPADDPNNQGEDEFEEAEQQGREEDEGEEPVPPGNSDAHLLKVNQHHPAPEEQLVMAGNPDQQEDNLEEQYQEDVDDEAQEEIAEGHREQERGQEDPYNEENVEQDNAREQEEAGPEKQPVREPNEDENYEEEEEPEEENNHRAEM